MLLMSLLQRTKCLHEKKDVKEGRTGEEKGAGDMPSAFDFRF